MNWYHRFAPKEERSLFWFFLADFDRLPRELQLQKDFWTRKGLPRVNDWFWDKYFPESRTTPEEVALLLPEEVEMIETNEV